MYSTSIYKLRFFFLFGENYTGSAPCYETSDGVLGQKGSGFISGREKGALCILCW
jgi:hypothetical protein